MTIYKAEEIVATMQSENWQHVGELRADGEISLSGSFSIKELQALIVLMKQEVKKEIT